MMWKEVKIASWVPEIDLDDTREELDIFVVEFI
jgi:hypothetical protein